MLIRFVYLDKPTLAGYVAQVDGGLIAETKVRLVKKGSAGGKIDAKVIGVDGTLANEDERFWTMQFPPEAQFQRLLAIAFDEPDTIDWLEVLDPNADFANVQVGETIAWECDVDIAAPSRLAARGGGGAQLLGIMALMAMAGEAGLDVGGEVTAEIAARIQTQVAVAQQLLDAANIKRIAVGRDSASAWTVFGPLDPDYFLVDDINNERLIVVGKVKRVIGTGETQALVNTEAMHIMESVRRDGRTSADATDNQVTGPALELDILAIYR